MDDFFKRMREFDDLLDDEFEFADKDQSSHIKSENELNYCFEKTDAGLDIYKVTLVDPTAAHKAKMHIHKLNRNSDDTFDVFRLDASSIPEKRSSSAIIYKDTECRFIHDPLAIVVNETDSMELNVGIRYAEKYYYLEGEPSEYPVNIMFAIDDDTYKIFDIYETVTDKYEALKQYSKLTVAQRKFFKNQFYKPKKTETTDESIFTPIRDEKALRVLYETCKDTYSDRTRAKAKMLLSELNGHLNYGDKADVVNQLSHILGIDTQLQPYRKKTYDEIKALMDKHIYGLDEFKERFGEFLLAMQYSNSSNFAALLVGPPGVGKTSVGKVIAECCEKPLIHIDCSGADVIAMSGLVRSYGGAKAGKVIDGFWEIGRTDAVVLADEIDKLSVTKEGNPYSVFLKALGPQKMLRDEYVDADTDVSSTIFIATANNIEDIPGYILNRFGDNVFYLDKYSLEEKMVIAENHLIPSILKEHNIKKEELKFTQDALGLIVREYCEDEGVRETESYIKSLVRKAIRLWVCNSKQKPLVIDDTFVREYLVKMKKREKSYSKVGF